jgi:hypothetical protein
VPPLPAVPSGLSIFLKGMGFRPTASGSMASGFDMIGAAAAGAEAGAGAGAGAGTGAGAAARTVSEVLHVVWHWHILIATPGGLMV